MEFDPKLRQAAVSLGRELGDRVWVSSVGVAEQSGHPVLVLYLSRPVQAKALSMLPSEWEHLPVMVRQMGKLIPAGKRE
jgi:hypothetical protein